MNAVGPALQAQSPGVTRPLLRYLGGKWRLSQWIIGHCPRHRVYVEPFAGAASVLLCKPRSQIEVINDVDEELVNLFRILRGPDASELLRQLALTPYARREYEAAWNLSPDPVERARRLLIRSHMGHATRGTSLDRTPSGFRRDGCKAATRVAGEWGDFPIALAQIIDRLTGVELDCRPALDVMADWNDPKVLQYLDPPYLAETRSTKTRCGEGYYTYEHELSVDDHHALLDAADESRAMILISGYASPLYDERLKHWARRTKAARAHRNTQKTEVLWISPAARAALEDGPLFAGGAI